MKDFDESVKTIMNSIINYNDDIEVFNKIKDKIKLRINLEKFTKVWNGLFATEMLKEDEQYYILDALFEITKKETFDPINFFYQPEIDTYRDTPIKFKNKNIKYWILHDVDQIDEHTFHCHAPITSITEGADNNFLTYNVDSQRRPKIEMTKNGNVLKLPDIKSDSTKSIQQLFEEGKHPMNQVTLNIRYIDGEELNKITYDKKTRTLTFYQDKKLYVDIIDGAHRITGALMAVHKMRVDEELYSKQLNKQLTIQIEHMDVQQAMDYVVKTASGNPLDEKFLASKNIKDVGLDMARQIDTKEPAKLNSLYGKISDYEKLVQFGDKYCYVGTISMAINYNFGEIIRSGDYRTPRFVNEHIIKVVNEIFGAKQFYIKDKKILDVRKDNILLCDRTFIAYVAMAKATYGIEGWEDIIDHIIDNLDITWENKKWGTDKDGLKLQSTGNLTNTFVKTISNYFIKLVEDEIQKEGVI